MYIPPFDDALCARLQAAVNSKTKPLGALGRFESLAVQTGLIRNTDTPQLMHPAMVVSAVDHGIAHADVSAHPQAVTAQTALNLIAGGVAVNVFCRQHGFALEVVNAGVAAPLWAADAPGLVDVPVGLGTRNFVDESVEQVAMTTEERDRAMALGTQRVAHHAVLGTNVITLGEMGIANTTSAACLMACLCNSLVTQCVGRGTGLDDDDPTRKRTVLEAAMARHADVREPLDVLARFGGPEVAVMVGAVLEAVQCRIVILIDGFIATVAVLVAAYVTPGTLRFCVLGHVLDECGHRALLKLLGARPLLSLSLWLDEGSGAALAYPAVVSTVALLREMTTFASAGVSECAPP